MFAVPRHSFWRKNTLYLWKCIRSSGFVVYWVTLTLNSTLFFCRELFRCFGHNSAPWRSLDVLSDRMQAIRLPHLFQSSRTLKSAVKPSFLKTAFSRTNHKHSRLFKFRSIVVRYVWGHLLLSAALYLGVLSHLACSLGGSDGADALFKDVAQVFTRPSPGAFHRYHIDFHFY